MGGLATVVGGLLLVAFPMFGLGLGLTGSTHPILDAIGGASFIWVVVALLLVPVGMAGFHALQKRRYGRLGLAGFWLTVVASLLVAWGAADYFLWSDLLQEAPPPWLGWGLLGMLAGFATYGIATLRAGVLPRWCGVTFILALPVALALSLPLFFASMFLVFGFAWLALGSALWARRGAPTRGQPRRVR